MFFPDAEQFLQKESAKRFPYFNFPADVQTIYQQNMGGYINPRMEISAQNKALAMYSGSIIDDVVLEIHQKDSAVFVHTNNDYLSIPDDADFSFGNDSTDTPFTMSAWVRMDDATRFEIMSKGTSSDNQFEWLFFTILVSSVSQLGDIIISYFKRLSKIKDTGKIIPGHGGLLDRVDGMIFAFPFAYIIIITDVFA